MYISYTAPNNGETANDLNFFEPLREYTEKGYQKKSGVYIIGVLINEKFCPLRVGQALDDLYHRVRNEHWLCGVVKRGGLNSFEELFDLLLDPTQFYEGIRIWNNVWCGKSSRERFQELFQKIKTGGNDSLIWFNCCEFFDHYIGKPGVSKYVDGTGHDASLIFDLPQIARNNQSIANDTNKLIDRIKNTKQLIKDNFYYAYWDANSFEGFSQMVKKVQKALLRSVEGATKKALETIEIYTYSHDEAFNGQFTIDLSLIQEILINNTNDVYPNPLRILV